MRPGPRLVVMVALAFISGAQSSTNQQQRESSNRGKLLSKRDESAKYETSQQTSTSFLSNINPWLSACDLAQPNTAPDLQGSCTAGTLPVAWINEGPGPPMQCPQSCQHNHRYNQNTLKTSNDNKNTNNYNNNNNNKINKNNNNNFSNNNNNNMNYNDINMENRLKENRQCLDYLGGDNNDEYSPSKICNVKSSSDIETKLKSIRLRHCCERDVASALHNDAYIDVLNGGAACKMRLNELIEADSLAERLTCEFMEILVRYDCVSRYSLIHRCGDCKEMYRRWVCSTFIPYFGTQNDIKSDPLPETTTTSVQSTNNNVMNNIDSKAQKMFMQDRILEDSNEIKRSRRKARMEQKRIRIRPCISVCQKVEQICPYMLPADRAPAYPTQYAGEPTFFCLDPNIDETGNQLYKSNHGPSECCYEYCKHEDGLCSSKCDPIFNINNETAIIADRNRSNTSKHHTNETKSDPSMNQTPNLFVKLDNGTYVLNDYSNMPDMKDMQCNILYNITQSTQHCSISQAQVAAVKSSANSFNYYPSSSSSSSVISILIQHLTTYNNLIDNYNDKYDNNNYNKGSNHHDNGNDNNNINRNNNSFTYQHLNLVEKISIKCIVAQLISHWTNLVWNLMKVIALQLILLQLATGS
ncbi:unnamed protein product [Chironomus riparius]|uniref:Uncharacterized protein n=1 Tax=Chironomus riparius TaxID=315576 RepID=A0A9N9S1K6_9DIPT|nr:unnamed protein product [Chironomus riparius]